MCVSKFYLAPEGLLQRRVCWLCHNTEAHVVLFKPIRHLKTYQTQCHSWSTENKQSPDNAEQWTHYSDFQRVWVIVLFYFILLNNKHVFLVLLISISSARQKLRSGASWLCFQWKLHKYQYLPGVRRCRTKLDLSPERGCHRSKSRPDDRYCMPLNISKLISAAVSVILCFPCGRSGEWCGATAGTLTSLSCRPLAEWALTCFLNELGSV